METYIQTEFKESKFLFVPCKSKLLLTINNEETNCRVTYKTSIFGITTSKIKRDFDNLADALDDYEDLLLDLKKIYKANEIC